VGRRRQHLVHLLGGATLQLARDVPSDPGVHQLVLLGSADIVHDRRQWVVVDHDQLRGVLGDVPALRDHQRHGIADEAHLLVGQRR
jgi:hypothetical protein